MSTLINLINKTMKKAIVKKETYNIDTPQKTKEMANVLAKHIMANQLSVNIVGRNYVMVEGWQFAGGLMGLFPQITEVREISPMKWMATAQIINIKTDKIVSTGYAICSKDEQKKKSFDEYAILSMAQTRAIGKAYRNYIGWIIKMAGYESTPAEEIKEKASEAQQPVASSGVDYREKLKKSIKWTKEKDFSLMEKIFKRTGMQFDSIDNMSQHDAQVVIAKLLSKK